jgi:hypothetical protein
VTEQRETNESLTFKLIHGVICPKNRGAAQDIAKGGDAATGVGSLLAILMKCQTNNRKP